MADLFPTQDVDDVADTFQDNSDTRKIWGRLLPLRRSLLPVDLVEDCYTFGRGEGCSVMFTPAMFNDPAQFSTFSKQHFKLLQEPCKQGSIVFVEDLSSNGTFINGTKIGRGKRHPLSNNDEISLSLKHYKCYIFSDSNSISDLYPHDVTEKYTVSRLIGRGACGEVRLVFGKQSCEKYAMKIVQKKNFTLSKPGNAFVNRIRSEVDILMKLTHPCIIGIYDVIDTEDALYMILELVEGGELFDRIVSLGQLSESDAKFLFLQMVIAVKYLHEHGITHRDLKPENILLTGSDNRCLIKVTDFGLSKLVDGNTMLRTFCGTPTYLAPEILKTAGSGTYTSAIDVWSLGVILYVCLVGYPPFTDERTDCDLQTQITKGLYDYPEKYWSGISAEAKDLVSKMLTVEPNERLTIQAVVEHPWLTDSAIQEEVQKLMASSTSPTAVIPPLRSQASFGQQSDESQPATSSTSCEDKEVGDVANGLPEKEAMNGKPLVRKRLSTTESDIPRKCMTR